MLTVTNPTFLRQTFRHYRILNLIAVVGMLPCQVNMLLMHAVSTVLLMLACPSRKRARPSE